jgi:FKBP12-rapamycin complex-associated protein
MIPLICQALTTAIPDGQEPLDPEQEAVWLEGLRLLCNPKLRTALSITSSIWLPLLLKGLDASRPTEVNVAALKLLVEVAEMLQPMKSCLTKPLRLLGKDQEVCRTEELAIALGKLDMLKDGEQTPRPAAAKEVSCTVLTGDTFWTLSTCTLNSRRALPPPDRRHPEIIRLFPPY